jgi:hypothetical protein
MPSPTTRRPVDVTAFAVMVLLCLLWAFNYVVVKLVVRDVSLVIGRFSTGIDVGIRRKALRFSALRVPNDHFGEILIRPQLY